MRIKEQETRLNLHEHDDDDDGTRYVILTKHWMWLLDDGFMRTETCWSSFYSCNYFNNLRILII